jgi:outer membrane protein assembly factor BamB
MKKIILIFFTFTTIYAEYNVQNWLLRIRNDRHYGLRPTERSQPIIIKDIIYFGSENGNFYAIHKNTSRIIWKKEIKNGISGNPVFFSGKLYFGGNNGRFYCLDAATGKEIWSYFNKYPSISTPYISNSIVYFSSGDNAIYALDALTGKWLWQYKRNFPKPLAIRGQSGPVFYKNYIYAGFSDGFFVKLFALDGKLIWEKKLNDYHRFIDIDSSAYVDDKNLIVLCYDGNLYNLNPMNGNTIWEIKDIGGINSVIVENDKIFIPGTTGKVLIVNKRTGKKIWNFKVEKGVLTKPLLHNDILFIATSEDKLYAINTKTRKKEWEFSSGSGFSTHPIIDKDNNIYFLTNYGNFYSLKPFGSFKL